MRKKVYTLWENLQQIGKSGKDRHKKVLSKACYKKKKKSKQ